MAFPSLQAPGPEAGRTFKRAATCVVLGDGKPEREDHDSAVSSCPGSATSLTANFPSLNLSILMGSTEIIRLILGGLGQDLVSSAQRWLAEELNNSERLSDPSHR